MKWSSILDQNVIIIINQTLEVIEYVKNISFLNPHNENIIDPDIS